MFVTDVKCSQATRQVIPNSRTGSSKASVSEAVVRTWHRTHVVKGRPLYSSSHSHKANALMLQVASRQFRHSILSSEQKRDFNVKL